MAVLLNNVWYSSLVEFGFLQLYSTGVKFKIGKAKVYVIEVCGHGKEWNEKKERF